MLEEYRNGQPVAFRILDKAIKSQKNVHAYLFDVKNVYNGQDIAIAFAKALTCPHHYTNKSGCANCNICHRIDKKNFPEIRFIEPDGLWIKKEQLAELKQSFSTKVVEGSKRIYIINQAEKLNQAAANCILKFLEEPDDDIIAILLTESMHQVLKTIVSRCQTIILQPDSIETYFKLYNNTENKTILKLAIINNKTKMGEQNDIITDSLVKKVDILLKFIKAYEDNKLNVMLDSKQLWHDYFKDKEEFAFGLEMMILFYKDVINFLLSKKIVIFDDYSDVIRDVSVKNNIQQIIKKLSTIILTKEKLKNNANTNLLFDKLIMDMEGGIAND